MDLEPLDRTQLEYVEAMDQWLKTPGLDEREMAIISQLLLAATRSLEDFDMCRRVALSLSFRDAIVSAAYKAQQHGFPMKWENL